jgi:hypothetical protein
MDHENDSSTEALSGSRDGRTSNIAAQHSKYAALNDIFGALNHSDPAPNLAVGVICGKWVLKAATSHSEQQIYPHGRHFGRILAGFS